MSRSFHLYHKLISALLCVMMIASVLPEMAFASVGNLGGNSQNTLSRDAGKDYIYTDEYMNETLNIALGEQATVDAAREYMTWQDPEEYRYTPILPPSLESADEQEIVVDEQFNARLDAGVSLAFQAFQRITLDGAGLSDLDTEEIEQITETFGVDEDTLIEFLDRGVDLDRSIQLAQLAAACDLSVDAILAKDLSAQDGLALYREMSSYKSFLREDWNATETDKVFREYLLAGLPLERVKNAYVINRALDIPIDELLADKTDATVYPDYMTEISKENYRLYSIDLGVSEQALADYAASHNKTFQRLEALINNGRIYEIEARDPEEFTALKGVIQELLWEEYQEYQDADTGAASSKSAVQQPGVVGGPTGPAMMSLIGGNVVTAVDPYLNDTFDYKGEDRYNVNLQSGYFTQDFIDAVIPGRNGLDLVIGHQYLSDQSFLFREYGVIDYVSGFRYVVEYQYQAYSYNGLSYIRVPADDEDWFVDSFNTLQELNNWLAGQADIVSKDYYDISVDMVKKLFTDIDVFSASQIPSLVSETEPNTYYNDLYGLGVGWKLMFSSVEREYENGLHQALYLHMADGTVHRIAWESSIPNLAGYELEDIKFSSTSSAEYFNGVEYAAYKLVYKDGKIEFFNNDGKLIGIMDRFGNTIKLVHSTQNNMPKIVITDTLNNVITISGSQSGMGQTMTVQLPIGSLEYYSYRQVPSINHSYMLKRFDDQLRIGQPQGTHIHSYSDDMPTTVDIFNNARSASNKYIGLETTSYLNGLYDDFIYNKVKLYINSLRGTREAYRLSRARYSIKASGVSGTYLKDKRYYYKPGVNMSGYPVRLPGQVIQKQDPNYVEYNYWTRVDLVGIREGNETLINQTLIDFTWEGEKFVESINVYGVGMIKNTQYMDYDKHLPRKIVDKYLQPGSNYREEISLVDYDIKRNVITTWSPLAEGVKSNTNYMTTYTYDTAGYNLPLTMTYKQDANTTILETYTLDSSYKKIVSHDIKVNGVMKAKTDYAHDAYGNVTSAKRYKDGFVNGVTTTYAYPNGAHLTEVTTAGVLNADGTAAVGTPGYLAGTIVTKISYDAMGKPVTETDANNLTTIITRNAKGDVTILTNPDTTTREYDRDYIQSTVLVTDERGTQLRYRYPSSAHNGESVEDVQTGTILSYKRYDEFYRLEVEGDPISETTYAYDSFSRVSQKQTKDKQTSQVIYQEDYAYDEAYNGATQRRVQTTVLGETGSPSIVTAEYFDKNGRKVKAGRYLGGVELVTDYSFDFVGNLVLEKDAFAADKSLAYSGKWEYDHAGRAIKVYNADGGFAVNSYDALGQLAAATDFAGTATAYLYDDLGRLLEEKGVINQSGGNTDYQIKRHSYDPAGNIKREEWTNNQVGSAITWAKTDYDYDSRNRLEYVTMYDGASIDSVTKYEYDGGGNILFARAGMSGKAANDGKTTGYTYDRFGNQLTMKDALNQTESRLYNVSSLMTHKTDRNGNQFVYDYTGLGQPKTVTVKENNIVTETITYSYYLTGLLKREESTTRGWIDYSYDSLGRLASMSESYGFTKQYTYDKADNRDTFLAKAGGATIQNMSYVYDNQKRLSQIKENNAVVGTYGYDANGNRSSLTLANGVVTSYAYNKANWLTGLTNAKGGATLSSYVYSYYADGNQRTKTDNNNRVSTYIFDGVGRLKSETESTGSGLAYTYDRWGNRKTLTATGAQAYSVTYDYDANNRLSTETKTVGSNLETMTYVYDANGNQKSWMSETLAPTGSSPGGVFLDEGDAAIYEYDAFNRMTLAFVEGAITSYAYRVDGLRKSKGTSAATLTHLWDGANIAADMNGGNLIASYVRGINLLRSDASAGQAYYLYNGHGDVTGLSNTSGVLSWKYDYDAFGFEREIAGQNPSADANPFRYCGEYFDTETDTYYLRARHYMPAIGRFLSEDTHWSQRNRIYGDSPLKINERQDTQGLNHYTYVPDNNAVRQSSNLYVYCGSNPIIYVDETGEAFMLVAGGVFAAGGAIYGGYKAYKSGESVVNGALKYGAIGGAIGLTGGAVIGALVAGTATASTAMVIAGVQLKIAGLMTTGYTTFEAFKKAHGSAGPNMAYHHVIPQTVENIQRFGATAIHNAANIVKIPHGAGTLHQMITNHYNTMHESGMRVYQWLQTQSFDAQLAYGLQKLTEYAKQLGVAIEFIK